MQTTSLNIHQSGTKNVEEICFQNRSEQDVCLDECHRIAAMHRSQRLRS